MRSCPSSSSRHLSNDRTRRLLLSSTHFSFCAICDPQEHTIDRAPTLLVWSLSSPTCILAWQNNGSSTGTGERAQSWAELPNKHGTTRVIRMILVMPLDSHSIPKTTFDPLPGPSPPTGFLGCATAPPRSECPLNTLTRKVQVSQLNQGWRSAGAFYSL